MCLSRGQWPLSTLILSTHPLMREKQGLSHMGLNTLRRCRRLKNWKGLPVPQPHGHKGKVKCDQHVTVTVVPLKSASSHKTALRATDEMHLPGEPEGWRSYCKCLAADSICQRWNVHSAVFPAQVRPQSHPCLRMTRGAEEGEGAPCFPGTSQPHSLPVPQGTGYCHPV